MKKLISTLTALALAGAPVLAFAEEGTSANDTGVSSETSATVDTTNTGTTGATNANLRAEREAQLNAELEKRETELEAKKQERAANAEERKIAAEEKKTERQNNRIAEAKERADREIDRRIEGLERLSDRIDDMRRLTGENKTSLLATLTAEIDKLTALRAQIAADTSTTTLRTGIESITKSYRIFALIMPKAAVMAAADRVLSAATQLEQFSTKLAERIAGNTDASLSTALTEANTKIADAKANVNAAVEKVRGLVPDNGDEALFQANKAAIREAHAMVKEAQQLLKEAHRIMADIAKKLRTANASVETNTEASAGTE